MTEKMKQHWIVVEASDSSQAFRRYDSYTKALNSLKESKFAVIAQRWTRGGRIIGIDSLYPWLVKAGSFDMHTVLRGFGHQNLMLEYAVGIRAKWFTGPISEERTDEGIILQASKHEFSDKATRCLVFHEQEEVFKNMTFDQGSYLLLHKRFEIIDFDYSGDKLQWRIESDENWKKQKK